MASGDPHLFTPYDNTTRGTIVTDQAGSLRSTER
jgi:hypothetical protein